MILEGIALKVLPASANSLYIDIPMREPAENPSMFTCVYLWALLLRAVNCCLISGTMGLSNQKTRLSSMIVLWLSDLFVLRVLINSDCQEVIAKMVGVGFVQALMLGFRISHTSAVAGML